MEKNIRIKLNEKQYRDSVYACWLGKNIGGTIGTPYEGIREELDVKGFATEAGAPLPNDDLDLQLVWLYNLEQIGSRAISSITLGESWLNLVTPHWNEYGISKANMQKGLLPPMSGDYNNDWRDSNGAWIRTEIWACLAPACPDIAAKYAMMDAQVDHGAGEGTLAAVFVAAMQSAAFVVKDIRKCIEIGLGEIPETSRVADSVRKVLECYDDGISARETRNIILKRNSDIGDGWFEAPSNIAYTVIGLIFGEGDFKRSIINAVNCGDDTDCTAATVGATLGILGGTKAIPDDWKSHIGDDIVTVSIRKDGPGRLMPKTCSELTERVVYQAPHLLFDNKANVKITDGDTEMPENIAEELLESCRYIEATSKLRPYTAEFDFNLMSVTVILDGAPDVEPLEEKTVTVKMKNHFMKYDKRPYNLSFRWWLPEGFTLVSGRKSGFLRMFEPHSDGTGEATFVIRAGETVDTTNKCVLEISADGRITPMYIPVVFQG